MSNQLKDWVMDSNQKELFLYVVVIVGVTGRTLYLSQQGTLFFWREYFWEAKFFVSQDEAEKASITHGGEGFAFCGCVHPVIKK